MIISRGFWSVCMRHPSTLAVIALTVGAEVGFHSWFGPSWVASITMLGLGAVLLAIWPPIFSRSGAWVAAQMNAQHHIDRQTVERIQQLEDTLRKLNATQAIEQLRGLREKLGNLTDVVEQRLNQGELAFARYRGTAEQVYLSAVDNLHDVAAALTSVKSIDVDYIDRRERELEKSPTEAGADRELVTLAERRQLMEEQRAKVSELLASNEAAMTALSNTAAALANVRTQVGHASVDSGTALAELETLAARAGRYAAGARQK